MKVNTNLSSKKSPAGRKYKSISRLALTAILSLVVLAIGVGTVVFSQSGQKKPAARDYTPAPVKNGKKYVATKEIIFDTASNKLRKPTAEETQQLVDQISSLTNRSSEGLTIT